MRTTLNSPYNDGSRSAELKSAPTGPPQTRSITSLQSSMIPYGPDHRVK